MVEQIKGAVVGVTGGTGSFGHAVSRRLLESGVAEIRIISRDEAKQDAMRHHFADPRLHFWIADVRDPQSLKPALKGCSMVFHAAALKQVPSCEFFPDQAVLTNVLGSGNVLNVAADQGVKRVVCLSTDKAVQPINAMGMSKALMEKTVQALARRFEHGGPVVCCVRYGNVLYSRGSVVPLFVEKMLANQTLPITDGRMTRFLLPLRESVGLVELALTEGRQGDLFIRKSPAATVDTLIEALGRLLQCKPATEIIGIRHGEKIHETLATAEEMAKAVDLGAHWRIPMDSRSLNYSSQTAAGAIAEAQPFSSDNAHRMDADEVIAMLRSLPEMQRVLKDRGLD